MLPHLAGARMGEPLKIACVGCGAGEEPYTFAMLLEDAGIDGEILALDLDATALDSGKDRTLSTWRNGRGSVGASRRLAGACRRPRRAALSRSGQLARTRDLHASRHHGHYPRPDFDLVSCRNVLIYLQRFAQARATGHLIEMIRDRGVLCLGEAEWPLPEFQKQLEPLPHKTRLFRVHR